ncbi:hypothetical protein B0H16DRAFT_1460975 [Mycena metata]|uniref:Uncharacterized protein n=1 Tax=Mycena metata TaxID=1033252 RepID=A0AAD7N967_9AGAR|nr:hypothetical protein B0H16DRAFT_1460975 [Mycena metata]
MAAIGGSAGGTTAAVSERCMLAAVWQQSGGAQNSSHLNHYVYINDRRAICHYSGVPAKHPRLDDDEDAPAPKRRGVTRLLRPRGLAGPQNAQAVAVPAEEIVASGKVSGNGVTRRQCDRTAAKSAARVAATGGSWRHLGGTGGTFTVPRRVVAMQGFKNVPQSPKSVYTSFVAATISQILAKWEPYRL